MTENEEKRAEYQHISATHQQGKVTVPLAFISGYLLKPWSCWKWHSHWWEQTCPQPHLVPTPASLFPYDWNLPAECLSAAAVPSLAHQGIMEKSSQGKDKYSKTAFCRNPDLRLLSDCNPTCLIPLRMQIFPLQAGFHRLCHLTFPFPCTPNNQGALD